MKDDILTEDDSHSGYIEKQSPSLLKLWQKRFFILDKKVLKYFKSQSDIEKGKPPRGVINFQQIWIVPVFKESQLKIDLKIQGSNRVFNLKCDTFESFEIWQKKLKRSINTSVGKQRELSMEMYKNDVST